MKKLILVYIGYFLGGWMGVGFAQDSSAEGNARGTFSQEPLPSGPLIKRLPSFSKWRIVFVSNLKDDPQGNPAEKHEINYYSETPQQIVVTRTDPIWHAIYSYKGNSPVDQWSIKSTRYVVFPGKSADAWTETYKFLFDFQTADFPDLEWVSPKTYIGMQKAGSNSYMVFRMSEAQGEDTVAWIDVTTRLPVKWKRGSEERVFQVLQPPTQALNPPQDVGALNKDMEDYLIFTGRMPPPKK